MSIVFGTQVSTEKSVRQHIFTNREYQRIKIQENALPATKKSQSIFL